MQSKRLHDRSDPAEPLPAYLYTYYTTSRPAGASAATASPSGHAAVVQACYSLYAACAAHARSSAVVRLFWKVLGGLLPEEAHKDQALMVSGLCAVVRGLPLQDASGVQNAV